MNIEIRNKFECSKSESRKGGVSDFDIRISNFVSDFEIRISDLFANVWQQRHEARSFDGVLDGALKRGAVAAALAAEELALAGAHLLQAGDVFVVHEGGTRAAFLRAKAAAILAAATKLLVNHSEPRRVRFYETVR